MIPSKNVWLARIVLTATIFLAPAAVAAAPIASLEYVETVLPGGLVQYDYTLRNLGDPVADAGFDLYDVTLFFSPAAAYDSGTAAPMWDIIGGLGFVNVFSLIAGVPPGGSDIGPGQSLGGFRFVFTGPIGAASFSALFTNPDDPFNPVSFDGNSSAAPVAVPEPGALMLLTAAGWWLARRAVRSVSEKALL